MALEQFIECLEHVPPEFERNMSLIRQLEFKTKDLMDEINQLSESYKETKKASERIALRKSMNEKFDKISSYTEDKIGLAVQTYALVDKNINQLIPLGTLKEDGDTSAPPQLIGFEMPIDPNEPTYCKCKGVSYGEMVACDNKDCKIEWFHYACVGLIAPPKGRWYCEYCIKNCTKKRRRSRPSRGRY